MLKKERNFDIIAKLLVLLKLFTLAVYIYTYITSI
jgi:ABC-type multidrug transport system permease subunit